MSLEASVGSREKMKTYKSEGAVRKKKWEGEAERCWGSAHQGFSEYDGSPLLKHFCWLELAPFL